MIWTCSLMSACCNFNGFILKRGESLETSFISRNSNMSTIDEIAIDERIIVWHQSLNIWILGYLDKNPNSTRDFNRCIGMCCFHVGLLLVKIPRKFSRPFLSAQHQFILLVLNYFCVSGLSCNESLSCYTIAGSLRAIHRFLIIHFNVNFERFQLHLHLWTD